MKSYCQKLFENLSYCTTVKLRTAFCEQFQTNNVKPKNAEKAAPFSRSGEKLVIHVG